MEAAANAGQCVEQAKVRVEELQTKAADRGKCKANLEAEAGDQQTTISEREEELVSAHREL